MSDETEHSLRGPSGAHRWRRCPGSIAAEANEPDKVGREAAQGSVFHDYAAMCLMFDLSPYHFPVGAVIEQDGYEITFDEEMQESMLAGLEWVREQVEPGDIIIIEKRVDISPWAGEGEFGTADVAIIKVRKRRLIQFDWKYGKGVPVSPVKNDQMYLYTLGVWNDFAAAIFEGIDPAEIKVTFVIEQPRAPGGGGEWETTMAEVLEEGKQIRDDAMATLDPNAPRVAGTKQCMFCRASGKCDEEARHNLAVMRQRYDELEENIEMGVGPAFDDPKELSAEIRSYIVLHWKAFKRFVDRCHDISLHELKAGHAVPLIKAVEGRAPPRKYIESHKKDADEWLSEFLGWEKAHKVDLLSPAEAEKELGKKLYREHVAAYVTKGSPKPILVSVDDKRPPIKDWASKYDDLDTDEEEED